MGRGQRGGRAESIFELLYLIYEVRSHCGILIIHYRLISSCLILPDTSYTATFTMLSSRPSPKSRIVGKTTTDDVWRSFIVSSRSSLLDVVVIC